MTRWGLFTVAIGCIVMIYPQAYNDFSQKILYCICGVTVLCLGASMVCKDKKNVKKKQKERRIIEVEERLYMNVDAFSDKIAESITYDITASMGKNIWPKQIRRGFSCAKDMKNKMKHKGRVKIAITDFETPRIYKTKFESGQGINTISYEIEQLDENHIGVTHMEDFSGASGAKDVNSKIISFFYNRGTKKKTVKLLHNMENYIQDEVKEKSEAAGS